MLTLQKHLACFFLVLDLPDQPNRPSTRSVCCGGVGGALSDERPYPDGYFVTGRQARLSLLIAGSNLCHYVLHRT